MSTDSATIDMPISFMTERLQKGDLAAYFPVHRAGRLKDWTHAEKLTNMDSLPGAEGFKVLLLPIKVWRATGAWARAAVVEDPWLNGQSLRLVDLTLPLMNASFEPKGQETHIALRDFPESQRAKAKQLALRVSDVVGRIHASTMDEVETSTHAGTHVDAPFHFNPTGRTIDRVPLDWLYGDGVLLDFARRDRGAGPIGVADVRGALERLGHTLAAGQIVLFRTGAADAFFDDPEFPNLGAALGPEAFGWLLDQGVRAIGCDAESIDGPLEPMVQALRDGQTERFLPVHYAGREREFCLIHKLDLRGLDIASGFKVAAFPIKIESASAAWTRAVAFVPTEP
jgi:kynurenine formamidase